MPEHLQPQKPSFDKEKDTGLWDDAREEADLAGKSARDRASSVSQGANDTLGNIDDILGEQDADNGNGAVSPGGLDAKESNPETEESESEEDVDESEAGLYHPEGDEKGEKKSLRGRLASSKKWLWAAGGTGGIVGIVVILLLLMFSSLKLPNLSENIIKFQFARVTREYAKSGEKLTDESLAKKAIKRLNDTRLGQTVNDLHDKATGLKDGALAKVQGVPGVTNILNLNDRYNPGRVVKNLHGSGISFGTDSYGRPTVTLSGAALEHAGLGGDTTFFLEKPTRLEDFKRSIPVYGAFLKSEDVHSLLSLQRVQAAWENTWVDKAGRLTDVGPIVRGFAMDKILGDIGASRIGYRYSEFKNKQTAAQQATEADKQTNKATAPEEGHVTSGVNDIEEAAQNAADEEKKAIEEAQKDPKKTIALENESEGTGIAKRSVGDIANSLSGSVLKSRVTGLLSGGLYQAVFLACVFDDAADANSTGKSIDEANTSNQKTFVQFAGIADEQKRGPNSNEDVGAFDNMLSAANNKAGDDTLNSIPYQRSSSGQQPDTSGESAAQSGPFGYQILRDTIGNDVLYNIAMFVKPSCPAVTSPEGLVGDIALTLVTSFYKKGLDAGADVATHSVIEIITKGFSTEFSKTFGKAALARGGKTLVAKNVVTKPFKLYSGFWVNSKIVAGVEFLGALSGASHSPGTTHNGYETGNNWVNGADAGANSLSSEQDREMMMGRPLTKDELCTSQSDDASFLSANFRSQSTFQRYLATSEPGSLLSRSVMTAGSALSGPVSKPLVSISMLLTKPSSLFGSLLNTFSHKAFAFQASNCNSDSAYYGNVQFGWSHDEEKLIASDLSYKPDENLAILAESGKAVDIAKTYGKCFGYQVDDSGNLVADKDATIGRLLTGDDPAIQRDVHGNVYSDRGDCAPNKLSYDSPDAGGDSDISSPKRNDLVFRWRLAVRYQHVQEQLSAIDNAGTSSGQ